MVTGALGQGVLETAECWCIVGLIAILRLLIAPRFFDIKFLLLHSKWRLTQKLLSNLPSKGYLLINRLLMQKISVSYSSAFYSVKKVLFKISQVPQEKKCAGVSL